MKKKKIFYIRKEIDAYLGDRDYLLYRTKKDLAEGYAMYIFCRSQFEKLTGIKLKDGDVTEIIIQQGKKI